MWGLLLDNLIDLIQFYVIPILCIYTLLVGQQTLGWITLLPLTVMGEGVHIVL